MTYTPLCWFAANVIGCGPCDGQLVRCHLIPKQLLKREAHSRSRTSAANDERSWVWGCGGPMGNSGHHGMLDHSRTLRIARDVLPEDVEALAAEWGLEWWLEREYGPKEQAA